MPEISVSLSRTSGMLEIEVLRSNQKHIVRLAIPDRPEQTGNQFDQSARLLELLVLLEQCNDVLKPRVKGIGCGDLVGNRFRAAISGLRFGGLFQLAAESFRNITNLGFVGKRLKRRLRRMS